MAKRDIAPVPGLYKNGTRWWIRTVRGPLSGKTRPLSTDTDDTQRANKIKAKLDEMGEQPKLYEWLDLLVSGEVKVGRFYDHAAAGTLHQLREQLTAAVASAKDSDLRPAVDAWVKDHLATLDIDDITRGNYERQVRYFIPANVATPKSAFTEDYIKAKLAALTGARHDKSEKASSSTKRRYIVALQQFIRWARKRVLDGVDPLADADEWFPKNNSPRATFHEFDKVKLVLSKMEGEARNAMTLFYGSGIEEGAFLDLTAGHVGQTLADGRGTIVAPGSKNEHREERTIFVDAWAWPAVLAQAKDKLPRASLFPCYQPAKGETATKETQLREAFYRAQLAAGLIAEPPRSEQTRKLLWGRVKPHTIHDARHSYCVNRSLGLDGEAAQDASFCANQLGHADETMVLKIYKKANVKERLRLIQQQQLVQAAKAAGASK